MNQRVRSALKRSMELSAKMTEAYEMETGLVRTNWARVFSSVLVNILPAVLLWISMRSLAANTLRNDTYCVSR